MHTLDDSVTQPASQHSPINLQADTSQRKTWRPLIAVVVTIVIVLIVLLAIPMPYVIEKPGPTYDVLASQAGTPMIEIDSSDNTESSAGELRMVTVTSYGGPGSHVSLAQLIAAWFAADSTIIKESDIYPQDVTREQLEEWSMQQMTASQSTAAAAALEELDYDVPATITLHGAVAGSNAEGLVEDGDILRAIITPDGVRHEANRASLPFSLARELDPGTEVTMILSRNNAEEAITFETYQPEDPPIDFVGSKFGIYLTADVTLPFPVTIHLEDVGGPSAGTIFALGIIDHLTGGKTTGGAIVAGTGAIGYDGEVQPIGGIKQKMYGAQRDGAQWFLAPRSNCDEVVGNIPSGLQVWPVSTLEEARDALASIRSGGTVNHPTCQDALDAQ
ncbi:MAG: S16 family serine protease [Actinomycetaceae bacterium]|nr:S16 family serine protease [Actinomycetaceae bacterium]